MEMNLRVSGDARITTFRLGERGGPGLACDRDGIALGPATLVDAVEAIGQRLYRRRQDAEIARILDLAYGRQKPRDLARCLSKLDVAVRALEDGNLPLAGIATVLLRLPPLTAAAFGKLARAESLAKYSPDQPRDEHGRWTSEAAAAACRSPPTTTAPVATRTAAARQRASSLPRPSPLACPTRQSPEYSEPDIHDPDEDALDPTAVVRRELFDIYTKQLYAIDPNNKLFNDMWDPEKPPTGDHVAEARHALDDAIRNAAGVAAANTYRLHAVDPRQFPDVGGPGDLAALAENVMRTAQPQRDASGRALFYDKRSNTLVMIDPRFPRSSSISRPGAEYVKRLLQRN
jgi:hypothetical protein